MEKKPIVVLCTVPDMETAKDLAQALVRDKLAACCNILPRMTSVYYWQDKIEQEEEFLLLIKTQSHRFDDLQDAIQERHPYDVPEIISVDITAGSEKYLDWISENIR